MDLATLFGLIVSTALVVGAIAYGGSLPAFADLPSLFIVVLGTLFVTMISFTFRELTQAIAAIGGAFSARTLVLEKEATRLVQLGLRARKEGLLTLQNDLRREPDLFLRQGFLLAVDGAPPELIKKILHADTATKLERHSTALSVLRRGAEIAPAMGLIGTLIGLVQMLGQLSDPAKIGPSMALAILTTFYGAVLAYMVFTPLAGKLERNAAADLLVRKIQTAGILSLARQENPRQLELTLNALLPPAHRIRVF